jgi:hypothetical protein
MPIFQMAVMGSGAQPGADRYKVSSRRSSQDVGHTSLDVACSVCAPLAP